MLFGPIGGGQIESPKAPGAMSEVPGTRSNLGPCEKPDAVGVARVVEIDTTGGPLFGLQHLKGHDFLRDREVVLTFDDGPHPVSTEAVLKALEDECVKATFFEIGQAASWHPDVTKQMIGRIIRPRTSRSRHDWLRVNLCSPTPSLHSCAMRALDAWRSRR